MQEHLTDKLFKEKFTDFSAEPSKHLWEVLEGRLEQKKNYHKKYIWLSCIGIFLIVAAFFIFNSAKNEKKSYAKNYNFTKSSKSNSINTFQSTSKPLEISQKEIFQEKPQTEKQLNLSVSKELPQRKTENKFHKSIVKAEESIDKITDSDTLPQKDQAILSDTTKENKKITQTTSKDTIQAPTQPKGTKIIIKLPEPEPSKEGKARDFASTKFGKFLKNVQKLKNAELKLTLNSKSLN